MRRCPNAHAALDSIENVWFKQISQELIKGSYIYPSKKRIRIFRVAGKKEIQSFKIFNPRIKIIERAILNAIEPFFEGS
jgi:hypothetical protein